MRKRFHLNSSEQLDIFGMPEEAAPRGVRAERPPRRSGTFVFLEVARSVIEAAFPPGYKIPGSLNSSFRNQFGKKLLEHQKSATEIARNQGAADTAKILEKLGITNFQKPEVGIYPYPS